MAKPNRSTFQSRINEMLNSIRHDIVSGVCKPGDFLPSEMDLAEQFQLSKSSVRVVLEKLVEEELIVKIPRVGTQVTERRRRKTVRFGVYPSLYEEADMGELIERFREQHPHIQIEPLILPYYQAENVKQLLQSGIVDVITLNHIDYVDLREHNQLGVFEPFAPKQETYPFLNELFMSDDRTMPVRPFIFSPVVLCYNKEHFREGRLFEPDSSWDWRQFRDVLAKLAAPNRFGLYFHLSSYTRWPIFLLQNLARFGRNEYGELSPKPDTLELLRFMRDLIHEDGLYPLVISFAEHDAEKLFKQQKVSVILTTYYHLNKLKDAEFAFDIAPLPKHLTSDTQLLTTGIAVGAMSANKEEAACFADYLLSEQCQTHIRRGTFSLPSNKWVTESFQSELPNKPSRLELHRELVPHYATHDRLQLTVDELQVWGACMGEYFSGLVDEQGLIRLFNKQLAYKTKVLV